MYSYTTDTYTTDTYIKCIQVHKRVYVYILAYAFT